MWHYLGQEGFNILYYSAIININYRAKGGNGLQLLNAARKKQQPWFCMLGIRFSIFQQTTVERTTRLKGQVI